MSPFVTFIALIAFFHTSEFALAWIYQRQDLSMSSFLFSKEYVVAMGVGMAEYGLERFVFGSAKEAILQITFYPGLAMALLGEAIRKLGMITAESNFTHEIKLVKKESHVLVQHGIYGYTRHPGYLGWFLWAVGTQVMLGNIISVIGFYHVCWKFFSERIRIEELFLQEFFPDYHIYASRVPVWIPGIDRYLRQHDNA